MKKKPVSNPARSRRCVQERESFRLIAAISLLVVLAGIWTARQAGYQQDIRMRRELIRQAVDVAAAINRSNVNALSFTASDAERPEFLRLENQLKDYADTVGIQHLYTRGFRNGQIFFGPSSNPSAGIFPGTICTHSHSEDTAVFKTGQPQIHGPFLDEPFVSALAPVLDPYTGEVLMSVEVTTDASLWRAAVRRAQWHSIMITAGLLGVLLLSGLILEEKRKNPQHRIHRVVHAEAVLSAVFLFLLTVILAIWVDETQCAVRVGRFHALVYEQARACGEKFYNLQFHLEQMKNFFQSSQTVTLDEFNTYCNVSNRRGAVVANLWIESPLGADITYPISYIEPRAGWERASGVDLGAIPECRRAMDESLQTGLITATGPLQCGAVNEPLYGVFIFQPVAASVQKGFVAFVLRLGKLLGGAQRREAGAHVSLFGLKSGQEPVLLAQSSAHCGMSCLTENYHGLGVTVPIFCFGKTYALRMHPDESWLAANPRNAGRIAAGIGVFLSGLISSVIALISSRRYVLEKLVERRTAELESSEIRFRSLVENLNEVFFSLREDGTVEYVSPAITDLLGYPPEDILGKSCAVFFYPDDVPLVEAAFAKVLDGNDTVQEYRMLTRSGELRWVQVSTPPVQKEPGGIPKVQGVLMDITERKAAEGRIRSLVQHLEIVREEERKRISRELHDDIGQILTAMKIDLVTIQDDCSCSGPVKTKMTGMQRLLSEGIQCVHSLCRRLRPGALDDLSLEDALEGLVDDWLQRNPVECSLVADIDDEILPDEIKTAVFRLVQEALTNISRHANASWVGVNLASDEQSLTVYITDNGCGMEAGAETKTSSFGLLGMRERVEALGGILRIESAPGKGTRIEASIPLFGS